MRAAFAGSSAARRRWSRAGETPVCERVRGADRKAARVRRQRASLAGRDVSHRRREPRVVNHRVTVPVVNTSSTNGFWSWISARNASSVWTGYTWSPHVPMHAATIMASRRAPRTVRIITSASYTGDHPCRRGRRPLHRPHAAWHRCTIPPPVPLRDGRWRWHERLWMVRAPLDERLVQHQRRQSARGTRCLNLK